MFCNIFYQYDANTEEDDDKDQVPMDIEQNEQTAAESKKKDDEELQTLEAFNESQAIYKYDEKTETTERNDKMVDDDDDDDDVLKQGGDGIAETDDPAMSAFAQNLFDYAEQWQSKQIQIIPTELEKMVKAQYDAGIFRKDTPPFLVQIYRFYAETHLKLKSLKQIGIGINKSDFFTKTNTKASDTVYESYDPFQTPQRRRASDTIRELSRSGKNSDVRIEPWSKERNDETRYFQPQFLQHTVDTICLAIPVYVKHVSDYFLLCIMFLISVSKILHREQKRTADKLEYVADKKRYDQYCSPVIPNKNKSRLLNTNNASESKSKTSDLYEFKWVTNEMKQFGRIPRYKKKDDNKEDDNDDDQDEEMNDNNNNKNKNTKRKKKNEPDEAVFDANREYRPYTELLIVKYDGYGTNCKDLQDIHNITPTKYFYAIYSHIRAALTAEENHRILYSIGIREGGWASDDLVTIHKKYSGASLRRIAERKQKSKNKKSTKPNINWNDIDAEVDDDIDVKKVQQEHRQREKQKQQNDDREYVCEYEVHNESETYVFVVFCIASQTKKKNYRQLVLLKQHVKFLKDSN